MILITELVPGDEILVFMRLGLALEVKRNVDGSVCRAVPTVPQKASSLALTKFRATVLRNETESQVLFLATVGVDSHGNPLPHSNGLPADIHYSAFNKIRLYSPYSYVPRDEIHHTGSKAIPGVQGLYKNYQPYRTLVPVVLC
jgi:hypothetical protein